MEKVARYRQIVQEVLTAYAQPRANQPNGIQPQLLFDTHNDHYQVLFYGWSGNKQTFFVAFHLDIQEGKVWLQQNNTDYNILPDFEAAGIPKQDIVLAIYSPQMRQFTDYAIA